MVHPPYPKPHHHSRRFYILVTTVVVGAIMLLLLANDGKLGLTGSAVGILGASTVSNAIDGNPETTPLDTSKPTTKIGLTLSYNTIPKVKQENTKISTLSIKFNDPQTKITLNEETLELKGLKSAELDINNFQGEIDFDGTSLSLNGVATKAKVNGIGISTKKAMKLSFAGLVYDSLKINGANLKSLSFVEGDGNLKVQPKLTYKLTYKDQLKMNHYQGSLDVSENRLVSLQGTASGLSVQGDYNFNLG